MFSRGHAPTPILLVTGSDDGDDDDDEPSGSPTGDNNTNNLSTMPLMNVFSLVALTPLTVRTEYSKFYPVSLAQDLNVSGNAVSPQSDAIASMLFSRFASLTVISGDTNNYGIVLMATTPSGRRFVIKFERLQEEIIVGGELMLIDRSDKSAKRDLIAHVQLNRMPDYMQRNIVLLFDWTRVRINLAHWLRQFGCYNAANNHVRIMAPDYAIAYQVMVMERAAGTAFDLFSSVVPAPSPVFLAALVAQIYASLSQLHERLSFKHNDLTLSNVFYMLIDPKHANRDIYYQLPQCGRWVRVPLAATDNRIFKMSDFGLSEIRHYTTDVASGVLRPEMTEWKSDFAETPAVIEARFDLSFFPRNLAQHFAGDQFMRQFSDDLADELASIDHRYDPEALFLASRYLRMFVLDDTFTMMPSQKTALEAQGHIVVPFCELLGSEYREIDTAIQ